MTGDTRKGEEHAEVLGQDAETGSSYVAPVLEYVGNLRDILAATGSPTDLDGDGFRDGV